MLLSKRLFPYPVLKNVPHQDFEESFFKVEFEQEKVDDKHKLLFSNLQYITNNDQFRKLINSGKVSVYAHFECSNTLYRKLIQLHSEPVDFHIDKKELSGKLYITAFAVANEYLNDYYDNDFVEDYNDAHFQIDKYDILGFDDGYSIDVIHDIEKDDKISSIFIVIPKIDNENDAAEYFYQGNKIIIKLPQLSYNQYDRLKYINRYQNLFFSLFAIPILAMSLNDIKQTPFDDLEIQYKWFISVKNAYKKLFSEELNEESFESLDCYKFSQKIFDNALIKTIDDLYNEGSSFMEEQDNEED